MRGRGCSELPSIKNWTFPLSRLSTKGIYGNAMGTNERKLVEYYVLK